MVKYIPYILFIFCWNSITVFAQTLPLGGVIEFEKRVNKYAFIEREVKIFDSKDIKDEFSAYKSSNAQFLILKSNLTFLVDKTVFKSIPDQNDPKDNYWNGKAIDEQINIVYNDFSINQTIVQKEILGDTYLIKDKIRPIKWKITNDTREIAGYNCRRANGIIMDSIYVVAFYTGEIPVQGGPESFSGLPGMILGLALPYENVSWFATKVDIFAKPVIKPPIKGKVINYGALLQTLEKVYGQFINSGDRIKRAML